MVYRFKEYKKSEILRDHLKMGGSNPSGERIDATSLYIERGGKPYLGVMGEYHFSRDKSDNWYKELCKMKAGGVGIVATYIFWLYHEESEGEFDFSGDLDIRKFILDAKRAGLDVVIRIGPWCHGECRNGGFPDWLLKKDFKLRDNNEGYMEKARVWYEKIYEQVKDLFYKDGGNIIGVQFENELVDNAEHILALKNMALEIGYDAPLYTATGWNSQYGAKIPVCDVLPVFAAYADAPWANHTKKLPPSPHYAFNTQRNDSAVGLDVINPTSPDGWRLPYERYPFMTCELGAGLHPTYHRRPLMNGMDAYAMSLVKLGCGNNLIGYYMYHGGVNKIGKLSSFNESKATGYPNDYPILNYDYQTALSGYGEAGHCYGLLNMLHMFANDFGDILAPMESVAAESFVREDDFENLRYCMRTDGESGFVFVNHYQRLYPLKDIENVQIDTGSAVFPEMDIKGDVSFILPFNLKMGSEVLEYATSQLLCKKDNTYFFASVPGIRAEYKFCGNDKIFEGKNFFCNGIRIVTLDFEEAKYLRVLDGEVFIGNKCNLYTKNGFLMAIEPGDFEYRIWNGQDFEDAIEEIEFEEANVSFLECEEPFEPEYADQLNFGGGARIWKKLRVDSPYGFIEVPYSYDVAQIYANGKLVADNYYIGRMWRIPASLIFMKEAYLVMSELTGDVYREF